MHRKSKAVMKGSEEDIKTLKARLEHCTVAEEHRNEHLDFMARMFSHNLRSPTAGIKMLLQLWDKVDEEDREEIMDNIKDASQLLFKMINDLAQVLLDYRSLVSEPEMIDLQQLIDSIKKDANGRFSAGGISIKTELEVSHVHYHIDHIRVILEELLDNSVKFCPPERSPEITIRSYYQGDKLMISIVDNACGFDLNLFEKDLFKMYKSLKTENVEEAAKGRGLFRVKNIVEINGGKIEASSLLDQGSTFFIELYREANRP